MTARAEIARSEIVLATLNAKWAHASFGLRYLLANLPAELRARTSLLELDINIPRLECLERILAREPRILGLGVYVWNVAETTALVGELKRLRPDLVIVLGGPEVSYETEEQEVVRLADHVLTGEADLALPGLLRSLLDGERPSSKVIESPLPQLAPVRLPYDEYTDEDLAHRVVYVEASRGCPYKCEFCLSSLDVPVRAFDLDGFLGAMGKLLDRGARNFKFVDRTFNLSTRTSTAILRFFLERMREDLHLHFEMVPDRLPAEVRSLAREFPYGALQFEVGIQSFTPGVNELVSRHQDDAKAEDNLRFLRDETRVHVHADLIFGLPAETLETFGQSVDRLLPLIGNGEIQIGILKRLRGTPIVRHETSGRLVFSPTPPYEVLRTDTASFDDVSRVKRFARVFDVFWNSREHARAFDGVDFRGLLAFSDWLHARGVGAHGIALVRRFALLWQWLTEEQKRDPREMASRFVEDFYGKAGRSERLTFLEPFVDREALFERQRRNRAESHRS